jgi:phage terminase large subunit GpA-like protein
MVRFFSNLVGEEGPRIQGVKGSRVCGEAYSLYAEAGNPRRTQIRAKRAIYGWKLIKDALKFCITHNFQCISISFAQENDK